eukprot:TRINITY_DN3226_c0_g2_i1.p1 TRINITY_DN3226_c0_g2~~TRINITY_DN3226_c0_g2_i1.p1  ORF type:complete len:186 (-),score=52.46 TRINITY_DN3226_c0_g2_i1:273-830(-)
MVEATEYLASHREVVLVVNHLAEGTIIRGERVSASEARALNEARDYVAKLARQLGQMVFDSVPDACEYIIRRLRADQLDQESVASILQSAEFDECCKSEFNVYDTDGTGYLSTRQVLKVLKDLHSQVRHLFVGGLRMPTIHEVLTLLHKFNVTENVREGQMNYQQFRLFAQQVTKNLIVQHLMCG